MPDFNILTCVALVKNKNVKDDHFITRQKHLFFYLRIKKSFSHIVSQVLRQIPVSFKAGKKLLTLLSFSENNPNKEKMTQLTETII